MSWTLISPRTTTGAWLRFTVEEQTQVFRIAASGQWVVVSESPRGAGVRKIDHVQAARYRLAVGGSMQ
jgi:hypothetical protein